MIPSHLWHLCVTCGQFWTDINSSSNIKSNASELRMNNTPLSQSYFFQFNQKEEVLIFFFTFLHTHTLPTRIYITSFLMEIYIYPTGSHFFCLSVLRHHLDFQNYVRASVVISVSKDDFRAKNPFLHQSILS